MNPSVQETERAIVRSSTWTKVVLDTFVSQTLQELPEQTEKWLRQYNEERPHDALGDLTPREFLLTDKPKSLFNSWS
jgi:putative transposase